MSNGAVSNGAVPGAAHGSGGAFSIPGQSGDAGGTLSPATSNVAVAFATLNPTGGAQDFVQTSIAALDGAPLAVASAALDIHRDFTGNDLATSAVDAAFGEWDEPSG